MARILMVNDEHDLLALCKEALQECGYTVDTETSGRDAIERAAQVRPDLLIVDWIIPDMDGHAVIAAFRSRPELQDIPVLAISALHDGESLARRAGADDFLQKPFDADELIAAARQLLRAAHHPSLAEP
jgi:DNA-binding response OmpR family regulator